VIRLRHLPDVHTAGDLVWFQPALDRLRALPHDADPRVREFFTGDAPLYIARAPGRLDVMGGIADYSGARVLELPLACSTTVLLQRHSTRRCDVVTRRGLQWHFFSVALASLVDRGPRSRPVGGLRGRRRPAVAATRGSGQARVLGPPNSDRFNDT